MMYMGFIVFYVNSHIFICLLVFGCGTKNQKSAVKNLNSSMDIILHQPHHTHLSVSMNNKKYFRLPRHKKKNYVNERLSYCISFKAISCIIANSLCIQIVIFLPIKLENFHVLSMNKEKFFCASLFVMCSWKKREEKNQIA